MNPFLIALANIGIGMIWCMMTWCPKSLIPIILVAAAVSGSFQFIAIIFIYMARQHRNEKLMKARDQLGDTR